MHKKKQFLYSSDSTTNTTQPVLGAKSTHNPLFEETSDRAIRAAHRRKRNSIMALTGLVCIGLSFLGYQKYQSHIHKEIAANFLKIENIYIEESKQFQEKNAKNPQSFMMVVPHVESLPKYIEFAKSHENHPLALHAQIKAISIMVESGQTQELEAPLDSAIRKSIKNPYLQLRLRKIKAGFLADQKKWEDSIKELEFIEKIPENPIVGEIKLQRARTLLAAGRKEDATALLKQLMEDPPTLSEMGGRSLATEAAIWLNYYQL